MYNLLRFLIRYHLFLLFVVLEGFCFFLIYRNSKYHEAAYINVANNVSGGAYQIYAGGVGYFYLRRYSDSLVNENARLRAEVLNSKFDNKIDSGFVSDSGLRYIQNYTYIAARVTMNTVDRPSNLIYLDRGSNHGIEKQMGVIAPNGIVGQVISVTENYAVVMSVLSKDFKVSAKFKKNEFFGNLHWNGGSSTTASLENIPKHVPVAEGDTVMTSGYSELFPRNVMIGVVKKVKSEADKPFLDVTVNLSTDFGNLSYVYIVKNLRKQEILVLDSIAKTQKND